MKTQPPTFSPSFNPSPPSLTPNLPKSPLESNDDMNHSQIPEQEVARYWDGNANLWADHVRKGWDAYREYFNNPAFFEFMGDLSGKTVLDAGCAVAGSRGHLLVCPGGEGG